MDIWAIIAGAGIIIGIIAGIVQVLDYLQKRRKKPDAPKKEVRTPQTPPVSQIPHNLPPRSEFIGREKEKARVHEALQSRSYLVSIDGIGGIGKTALALEVAYECLHASQGNGPTNGMATFDGFIWTTAKDRDLALDDLFDAVARTLDYPGIVQKPAEEKQVAVRKLLQEKPYLLIVDNFETITDVGVRGFLLNLPEPSKTLITTREQQSLEGRMISLKHLTESEGLALIHSEGTRLGLASVQKVEDLVLLRLHQATGGAPLAIKWAVGQIKRKGQSLDTVLAALQGAKGDIFEAIFARSWSLLFDEARSILMAMSIFPAAASREAIRSTSSIDYSAFEEALGQLVEMSLVDASDTLGEVKKWCSIHPLTRAFAGARLEEIPELGEQFHLRAAEYFLRFAQRYGGSHTNWPTYGEIEQELPNITGMANWCYEKAGEETGRERFGRILIDLGWALRNFFWTRCYWHDGIDFFEKVIDASEHLGDLNSYGWRAYDLGWLYWRIDLKEAYNWAGKSLHTFESIDNERGIGFVKHLMGSIAREGRKYAEAERFLREAMERLEQQGMRATDPVVVKLSFGILDHQRGNLGEAECWLRQVIDGKDETYEVRAWPELGMICLEMNDLRQAQCCFERGLEMASEVGRKDVTAHCNYGLARIDEKRGNYEQALRLAVNARDIYERLGLESKHKETQVLMKRLEKRLQRPLVRELGKLWRSLLSRTPQKS